MLFCSKTDIGKKRELNEDYIYTSGDLTGGLDNLFVVADGMGGHNAGDYASKYTVLKLVEAVEKADKVTDIEDKKTLIKEAIDSANSYVYECSIKDSALSGMGSTLVLTTLTKDKAIVANVGDSRLYLIRNNEIIQVTKDHSFVEEMVNLGELDREAARNHPDKNIITRAVGVKNTVLADFFVIDLEKEDKILLCSDGLTNMVRDEEILEIIQKFDIDNAVTTLIDKANLNGGKDNISAVVVEPFGGCK